ncbi:YciI family protein [Dactylosporangium sp. NPDC000521]|uniref:YciI family protein n=1 Tax=Dactylosporangium sp. NPDC000521 TaxID=3363975 RepID=UPI0036D1B7B3
MARYLLIVDYNGGDVDTPMEQWTPQDIAAHMDYYGALRQELLDSGELVDQQALTGPEHAKVVTSDGVAAPVVTDGPFAESKELLAGYQLVDVDSEARAIEIAAKISCVPGPGGVPQRQPITVRRVMDAADFELLTSEV